MARVLLSEVYGMPKGISVMSGWQEHDGGRLSLVIPLDDSDGVTIEGMQLRGRARKTLPDADVSFQLELHAARMKSPQLERIDWRPRGDHRNPNSGRHADLRRKSVMGSHVHPFERHYMKELDVMQRHMWWAEPLAAEPANFSELLAVVGARFRITGLQGLPPPPWWESALLFGAS
jgi:hypothetical protein